MQRFGLLLILMAVLCFPARSQTIINFESLPDGTILGTQFPGLSFSNGIILTAGVSLNEFEFPPHSGTKVASDNGGPMSIAFSPAFGTVSGYFTYIEPLTVVAFDSGNNQVASIGSHFSNNQALSGDPGSTPNELLTVSSSPGVSKVTITGDPSGGSFTLDDLTLGTTTTVPTAIPTLTPTMLLVFGLLLAALGSKLAARSMPSRFTRSAALLAALLLPLGLDTPRMSGSPQSSSSNPSLKRIDSALITPTSFPMNRPTAVTVTARVAHPTHIKGSLNLIRFDVAGEPVIVGRMHDDGKNGDAQAGDGIYTLQPTFNETSSGVVRLRVSAAFHRQIRRVLSEELSLVVVR